MNTFKEIDFEPVPEEDGDAPFGWQNIGMPFEEIAKAITHYTDELDKLPWGKKYGDHGPWRVNFNRTQWWHESRNTGELACEGTEEEDAIEDEVTIIKLYTGDGIVDRSGRNGLLAVYEFWNQSRMKVKFSLTREARRR